MRMDIAAQTDVGQRKRNNEDYYGVFREDTPDLALFTEGSLLCVADGLGGHVGGEIASKLAVSMIKDAVKLPAPQETGNDDDGREDPYLTLLCEAIQLANDSIHRTNKDLVRSDRPMGTTLLVALIQPRKVYIGNVGDSRCYHIRDGEILAKTEDHSWVDEQVKQGLMSRAEAESDGRRNIVTRCIGTHPEVSADTYTWHVVSGDRILMCTDGLVNMARDSEIRAIFRKHGSSAEIAYRLIELANENGGRDNVTVIVAHISPTLGHRISSFFRHHGMKLLWGIITLLFGAVCFAAGYYFRDMSQFPR